MVSGKYHACIAKFIPKINCFPSPVKLLDSLKIYRINFAIQYFPTLLFSDLEADFKIYKLMFPVKVGWLKGQCILKLL